MPKTKKIEEIEIPIAAMGNRRKLQVIRYGSGMSGKKAYLQAGLHADEPPGFVVMHHLIKLLDDADKNGKIQGEIILVPAANPIGLGQWTDKGIQGRFESYNGVNFNRKYIELTEPVARRIQNRLTDNAEENVQTIRNAMLAVLKEQRTDDEGEALKNTLMSLSVDADIVLDLHCDYDACLHIYMGTPLWPDAIDLSAQLGSKVTLLATNSGGEPFDEACSKTWWELAETFPKHPVPSACLSATVELRGIRDVNHDYGKTDAKNLFTFLKRRGFIQGVAPRVPRLLRDATPLSAVEHVKATAPGVVIYKREIGEKVQKGDIVAEIVNPLIEESSKRVTKVRCQHGGILFTKLVDRYAKPGRLLVKIAGKSPIKGKGKHLLTA